MTPHMTPEMIGMICAGLALLMAAVALFLFAQLVDARRKARLWDEFCTLHTAKAYTLTRRGSRLRLTEVRL